MISTLRQIAATALVSLLITAGTAIAQVTTGEGPRYPGTSGDRFAVDTSALRSVQSRTEESSGLLEGPVDPNHYMMGPNDEVMVSIVSAHAAQYSLTVTADGHIVIPGVGDVDVRGKSLAEARTAVDDAVSRVYHSGASLALRRVRRFKVHVLGAVLQIGTIIATPVTRVSEAIGLAGGTVDRASKRDIVIYRGDSEVHVDLLPFYAYGDMSSDPYVQEGDRIFVGFQDPKRVIDIEGAVLNPGEFTWREGDSISSLIRYATGFRSDAIRDHISVIAVSAGGDTLRREYVSATPDGRVVGDRLLEPGERVFVRSVPNYRKTEDAVIAGEVRYPGHYAIEPGTTRLLDVIRGSGGLLPDASVSDAELVRRQLWLDRDLEYERILNIAPEDRTDEEVAIYRKKSRERRGIMSIDFRALLAGDTSENIVLRDNDSIFVPNRRVTIKVTGKVKNPGSLIFHDGTTYSGYIALAGGYGWRADKGEVQVIKGRTGEEFLASNDDDYSLEPGDEIYVPEEGKADIWDGLTTALTVAAQLATLVAVVLSITRTSAGN